MYKDIYLHLDCETASLRAHTGKLWSIGAVATYNDYVVAHDQLVDPYFYVESLPRPDQWDQGTLKWALEQYGPEWAQRLFSEGKTDFSHVWTELTNALNDWIDYYQRAGLTVHIVANHTDFDITFLRVAYDKITRKFPVRYNCIWDMPSMISAATRKSQREWLQEIGVTKDTVAHDALADAKAQMKQMRHFNVYLPPYHGDKKDL